MKRTRFDLGPLLMRDDEEILSYWIYAHSDNVEFLARAITYYAAHDSPSEYWELSRAVIRGFCEAVKKP